MHEAACNKSFKCQPANNTSENHDLVVSAHWGVSGCKLDAPAVPSDDVTKEPWLAKATEPKAPLLPVPVLSPRPEGPPGGAALAEGGRMSCTLGEPEPCPGAVGAESPSNRLVQYKSITHTHNISSSQQGTALGSYRLTHNVAGRHENFSDLGPVLGAVRKDPELSKYYKLTRKFLLYLRALDGAGFSVSGFNNRELKREEKHGQYIHRWTTAYRKKLLAKLYLLDEYIERGGIDGITMMTLTTYQGSRSAYNDGSFSESVKGHRLTIEESFQLLRESWDKLSKMIRHVLPGVSYIWIMEPHKTGYPHLHVVLFSDVSIGIQERLKTLWSEKYRAGSYDRGADFEVRRPEDSIQSIRNYLMKYIAKGFVSTNSKYGNTVWSPGEMVFNAVVWSLGCRTFQPSRGLQQIMGWNPEKDGAIWWSECTVHLEDDDHQVWLKNILGWIPGRNDPGDGRLADPEDLAPEGPVTLQLWKNKYKARYEAIGNVR